MRFSIGSDGFSHRVEIGTAAGQPYRDTSACIPVHHRPTALIFHFRALTFSLIHQESVKAFI